MSEISLETVTGKLNRLGYDAFMRSLRHAKKAGNRNVELAHWMLHILSNDRSDISLALDHYKVDRARALKDLTDVVDGFRKNETEMPGVATQITDVLDRGWHYATLFFGETQIRTGHVLVAALKSPELRRSLSQLSKQFASLDGDARSQRCAHGVGPVRRGEPAADGRLGSRRARGRSPLACRRRRTRQYRARPFLGRHDGQGQEGRNGPGRRPRRGDPQDHRRADAAAPEQSDPDRRGGRRKDRGGGRFCAEARRRRRAAAAQRGPPVRARHRPDAGRRVDEG